MMTAATGMNTRWSKSYSNTGERKGIELVPKEIQLLKLLIENAGRVMTRERLIDGVWGIDAPLPVLEQLGITREEAKRNVLLSSGQQQRVAIARALASDARVILADEPTGNLDEDTAAEITALLKDSAHRSGKCVVVVTHSNELAKQADVVFWLRRGELQVSDRL